MTGLIVAILVLGFLFILTEVFVPGAVLGILGVSLLVVGVVLSFREFGGTAGAWVFAGTAAGVLGVFLTGLKILPRTRVGRKLLLSEKVEGGPHDKAAEQERQHLLGREGKALTDLRPAGIGLIDGRRWDIVTDGGYITEGESFRVVRVEGVRIVVSQTAGTPSMKV